MEILEIYNLLKEFVNNRNMKKEDDSKKYIDDIFNNTEIIKIILKCSLKFV